jgi:hypothetical protein
MGMKYSAAITTAVGITLDQQLAILGVLKRENISGEEGGVMLRKVSARVAKPTNEGRIVLDSAGIKYDDYSKLRNIPVADINNTLNRIVGKGIGEKGSAELQKRINAGELKTQRDFNRAVLKAYEADNGALVERHDRQVHAATVDGVSRRRTGWTHGPDRDEPEALQGA